ncbi:hypothetical protein PITC_002880 [Penicillium italicum]|uniref:Uncharacterized protein n=1 Tax=Penicillium italicum TaxID=40296 RepID=A0A0A2L9C0_PENIT|nr:hypothetical protein PITC_002880 [Penicillium italicum]
MTECLNNRTNVGQMTDTDEMIENEQACLYCAYSAVISTYNSIPDLEAVPFHSAVAYDVIQYLGYMSCDTKPSLLAADEWFDGLLTPGHWADCRPYPERYDCAGDLGYGRADANRISKFYHLSSRPNNGTKTMPNVGGLISTPVTGNTFTWKFGLTVLLAVTVSSADATATAGTKATSGSDVTATSSATGTAESDVKPGMGSFLIVPSWSIAGSVGFLILLAL